MVELKLVVPHDTRLARISELARNYELESYRVGSSSYKAVGFGDVYDVFFDVDESRVDDFERSIDSDRKSGRCGFVLHTRIIRPPPTATSAPTKQSVEA